MITRNEVSKQWEEADQDASYAARQNKSWKREAQRKADDLWKILSEEDDERMEEAYWNWYDSQ